MESTIIKMKESLPTRIVPVLRVLVLSLFCILPLKEEIRNRFNIISEEREIKFNQNSENLMKIG